LRDAIAGDPVALFTFDFYASDAVIDNGAVRIDFSRVARRKQAQSHCLLMVMTICDVCANRVGSKNGQQRIETVATLITIGFVMRILS
jgi:hypothetical protein